VRQAFPDGIYWLAIGQVPNLLNLQGQLARQLTGAAPVFTTEQEGKNALHEALEGRLALVVLDDVWNVDHADAFSVTAPPARLLITTRNREVLVGLGGAEEHRVDLLSPAQAHQMLATWTGNENWSPSIGSDTSILQCFPKISRYLKNHCARSGIWTMSTRATVWSGLRRVRLLRGRR
jgi:hypothetical protein